MDREDEIRSSLSTAMEHIYFRWTDRQPQHSEKNACVWPPFRKGHFTVLGDGAGRQVPLEKTHKTHSEGKGSANIWSLSCGLQVARFGACPASLTE